MKAARKKRVDPKHQEPDIAIVEKENPLWSRDHAGDKTNVRYLHLPVNMRESAITMLAAKGVIDEAQCAAADRFRKAWEALGGAGAKAMDYSKEPVDGGGPVEPITVKQLSAGQDLKAAQAALEREHGRYAYKLVGYVCGEGHSIHTLTETRRQRDTMTDNLRSYLDVLAGLWGYAQKGSLRHRNDLTRARENDIRG